MIARRLHNALQATAYLALAIPLGIAGAAVALVYSRPGARRLAKVDRRQANRLLGAHLPPPARLSRRLLAFQALKLPVAVAAFAAGAAPIVLTVVLASWAVQGIGGIGPSRSLGPAHLGLVTGLVLLVLTLAAAVVSVATLEGLRSLLARWVRHMIAPGRPAAGPVREMLAERLGDRSLSILYWLPEREIYVDESGRRAKLPDPASGRAWTAVDRDGHRVAAIVHEAELDAGPELVQAAAAAAVMALDNERLKAELRARVEELRRSRVRIVEAGDAARRRIERDLHDGAQQQLVSLSLDLRMLATRFKEDPQTFETVGGLSEKLSAALAELRELARGIHPAILSDHGLRPAILGLATRTPVDVECVIEVEERLPAPIEAGAYFTVAEALTNVARYAAAKSARVEVRRVDGDVVVTVADDGVGGADAGSGSGLRGLGDRIGALDGTLTVESPPGEGTRLIARIPTSGNGAR